MPHPYCTAADVTAEFPELDDDSWGVGIVPSLTQITARIEEHDQDIDASLEERFAVPFDPVPPSIMRISRDLTVADVRRKLLSNAEGADTIGPAIRKEAAQRLADIKSGAMALDAQGAPQADTIAGRDRSPAASWETDTDAATAEFTRDRTW